MAGASKMVPFISEGGRNISAACVKALSKSPAAPRHAKLSFRKLNGGDDEWCSLPSRERCRKIPKGSAA